MITSAAPYFYISQLVTFDSKMWRIGAYYSDDVYSSVNGVDWLLEQDLSPFGQRSGHTCTVHQGKVWLLSGSDILINELTELPDVWSSSDGVNWDLVSSSAGFSGVAGAASTSFDGKLWLLGGGGGWQDLSTTDDVWYLE